MDPAFYVGNLDSTPSLFFRLDMGLEMDLRGIVVNLELGGPLLGGNLSIHLKGSLPSVQGIGRPPEVDVQIGKPKIVYRPLIWKFEELMRQGIP